MSLLDEVKAKLQASFSDAEVEVIDESQDHVGHNQDNAHFHVIIKSKDLEGKSRVEQHQMVYAVLGEELKTTVHALRITVK